MTLTRAHVLSIQDNDGDGTLLQQVWGVDPEIKLTTLCTGSLAMAHLKTVDEHIPSLILLGGRFPVTQMATLDVLVALKADPQLRCAPVIIVSGAPSPEMVKSFYDHHAACVVALPGTLQEMREMLGVMKAFWLGVAQLPGETNVFYR